MVERQSQEREGRGSTPDGANNFCNGYCASNSTFQYYTLLKISNSSKMSIGIYNTTRARYLKIFLTAFRRIEKFSMLFSDYGTIRLVFLHIQFSVFKNILSLITILNVYHIYKITIDDRPAIVGQHIHQGICL